MLPHISLVITLLRLVTVAEQLITAKIARKKNQHFKP